MTQTVTKESYLQHFLEEFKPRHIGRNAALLLASATPPCLREVIEEHGPAVFLVWESLSCLVVADVRDTTWVLTVIPKELHGTETMKPAVVTCKYSVKDLRLLEFVDQMYIYWRVCFAALMQRHYS